MKDNLGFWIPRHGFRIPGTAFRILCQWNLDSDSKAENLDPISTNFPESGIQGCLPFYRKIRLGCRKHNGKRFTSLPWKYHIRYGLDPKESRICVA